MDLRFGVFVPQGWKMDLAAFPDATAKWNAMRLVAHEADHLGYESLWLYDHFHTVPRPEIEATFECWSTTAALAAEMKRIRIGQMVTCNAYRHPALLAKMAASIDVISGGRLEFGIGAGWYEHEFRAYGFPYPPVGERLRQLDEAVQVIKAMWSEPRASFKGRYYTIDGAINEPKPLQKPHPRIWIGGGGEKVTLRIVAQRGDASNFGGTVEQTRHKCEVLKAHCRTLGRDYDAIIKSMSFEPVIIRETEAEVRAYAERVKPAAIPSVDAWAQFALIGTPERCVERLRAYVNVGISYFILYFHGIAEDRSALRLFAERVIPALRAA